MNTANIFYDIEWLFIKVLKLKKIKLGLKSKLSQNKIFISKLLIKCLTPFLKISNFFKTAVLYILLTFFFYLFKKKCIIFKVI